jgi:hypothetical protein
MSRTLSFSTDFEGGELIFYGARGTGDVLHVQLFWLVVCLVYLSKRLSKLVEMSFKTFP